MISQLREIKAGGMFTRSFMVSLELLLLVGRYFDLRSILDEKRFDDLVAFFDLDEAF